MTITLEEIQNMRFHMARPPREDGYRASEVDHFIDRVQAGYAALILENQRLRAQVAALEGTSHDSEYVRPSQHSYEAYRRPTTPAYSEYRRPSTQANSQSFT